MSINSRNSARTDKGRRPRIAGISDTSFGFGSPQLGLLVASLRDHYGAADCVMYEPDIKGKHKLSNDGDIPIERIATRMPPHFDVFHVEFNIELSKRLATFSPDIVIVTSGAVLPALLKLRKKPRYVIYYMLENLEYQTSIGGQEFIQLNHMAREWLDLICVPEMQRASFDFRALGWHNVPVVEILNVSSSEYMPGEALALKIINAGSICESTLCDYLEDDRFSTFSVDVYGMFSSDKIKATFDQLNEKHSKISYRGVLSADELRRVYPKYAYSLCMWRPSNINQIHASPNKLFQSISHGVPPIAAPHPQCVRIIREYGCGILMDGWSRDDVARGIRDAVEIYQTPLYEELVANCAFAFKSELNWPHQFNKIMATLPEPSEFV